jgi:hypothetical protein
MIRDIEKIFAPVAVSMMDDEELELIASEPANLKGLREFLKDRTNILGRSQAILRKVMRSIPA